ncbi:MAG: type II toxin-antitoxin system PemK/MazF family toxin [Candidatus Nanoarchaeia archaeon]|nr:type II toxin-antitoxin system PemK/MazF family toxin [Candidatus Nanoarchaeia archaeon]MDD5588222.1 type II toxin-antitoxin system PemK/MazF family toxin [Candidatus Nanoarchaeia archaeon]
MINIKRGDLILVNLDPVIGSEQGKIRPAVVIQNNVGNEYSPTIIIAPITFKIFEKEFPTNVQIFSKESGLEKDSTILLNQIRTIDKIRVIKKLKKLDDNIMEKVDYAIKASLDVF